ncbi:Hem8p [Cyanidiococcus yangmingshanensis]|uniref:Hem8p n=1 Tax=Cyanidiococcus yangmingshanensis TaxID=2690220 RepID=A0A7J7IF19_9RHOD|nr:Hem8p [Cyanidiococcus yangmingshanensis]
MFVATLTKRFQGAQPLSCAQRSGPATLTLSANTNDGVRVPANSTTALTTTTASQAATALATTPGIANRSFLSPRFQGRTGLILVNIGTPASLRVADVREYLRAFLGDDRVVDIRPRWLKALLLQILLLTRPAKSAEAYANIWDEQRGSPLLYYSEQLAAKLQERLGDAYAVAVGMQFGEPNLVSVMRDFRQRGIDRMIIVPLFPQYASSTTGSASEMAYRAASVLYTTPYLRIVPAFYDHPGVYSVLRPRD